MPEITAAEVELLQERIAELELTVRLQTEMLENTKGLVLLLADAFGVAVRSPNDKLPERTARRVITEDMRAQMRQMHLEKVPIDQMALILQLHDITVRRELRAMNLPIDSQRLVPEVVAQFAELFRQGKSVGEIARLTGKHKTTVASYLDKMNLRPVIHRAYKGNTGKQMQHFRIRKGA